MWGCRYVSSNPQYADASSYASKFRQLQQRAMATMRTKVAQVLQHASQQVTYFHTCVTYSDTCVVYTIRLVMQNLTPVRFWQAYFSHTALTTPLTISPTLPLTICSHFSLAAPCSPPLAAHSGWPV